MARVIIYNTQTGNVIEYKKSADTPQYEGRPDVLINPDMSPVEGIDRKYWMVDGDPPALRAMTKAEQEAINAGAAAEQERIDSKARATKGRDLIADLNAAMVKAKMSEDKRRKIVIRMQDVVLLLITGQLKEAKKIANSILANVAVSAEDLDVIKEVLNREIS